MIFIIINLGDKMIERFTKQENIKNGYISASRKIFKGNCETHWHEFFEIEYIISGKGSYIIDGEVFEVKPGMTFFMTPISFHRVSEMDAEVFNIMFSANACNSVFLTDFCKKSSFKVFEAEAENRIFLESVMGELVKNLANTNFASSLLDCIIAKLQNESGKNTSKPVSVSKQAQLYILNNFRQELTLEEISRYAGFTPTYFSRIFKEETGMNFKEYLNSIRFEYAEKLVRFSNMSITQICGECGFNDYANFIRRFKLYFGMSPINYRKKNNRM